MDIEAIQDLVTQVNWPWLGAWFGLIVSTLLCLGLMWLLLNRAEELRNPSKAFEKASASIKRVRRPWRKHLEDPDQAIPAARRFRKRIENQLQTKLSLVAGEWFKMFSRAIYLLIVAGLIPSVLLSVYIVNYGFLHSSETVPITVIGSDNDEPVSFSEIFLFVVYQARVALDFTDSWLAAGTCTINGKAFFWDQIGYEVVGYRFFLFYGLGAVIEFFRRSVWYGLAGIWNGAGSVLNDSEFQDYLKLTDEELVDKLRK